jgi:hypothetical protein
MYYFTFIRHIKPGTAAKNATVGAVYFWISSPDVNNISDLRSAGT